MKKFLENHSISLSLISWRIGLFAVAFLAADLIPKFGNSFPYWAEELVPTKLPEWVWGFGNFDGVHYLRIAKGGYFAQYTQAFFPLYPNLIGVLSYDILKLGREFSYFFTAVFLSTICFFTAIYFLYKLFLLDFNKKVATRSALLLIFFPTAFYFGTIYTESIFLLLAVISICFARRKNYLVSGVFAALASGTRLIGIVLFILILIEILTEFKNKNLKVKSWNFLKAVMGLLIAPLGFIAYTIFLQVNFNDPLYFLTAQNAFGAERSSQPLILLPQVFYRYLKILISVPWDNYAFFISFLELSFSVLTLLLLILTFRKSRLSYWLFSFICFIIPTMTGTFSSMPRYVLMCFLLLPFLAKIPGVYFKILLGAFIILQSLLLGLFVRGYWVS